MWPLQRRQGAPHAPMQAFTFTLPGARETVRHSKALGTRREFRANPLPPHPAVRLRLPCVNSLYPQCLGTNLSKPSDFDASNIVATQQLLLPEGSNGYTSWSGDPDGVNGVAAGWCLTANYRTPPLWSSSGTWFVPLNQLTLLSQEAASGYASQGELSNTAPQPDWARGNAPYPDFCPK